MSTPPTFAGCQTSARGARSSGGLVVDVQTIKGDVLGSQTAAQRDRKLLLRQEGAAKERTAWGGGYISIGPVEQMLCQLRNLRYLNFGGAEAFDRRESLRAFPACMGNLSKLIHVRAVGCNLTGSASLPSTLSNLKDLKIFEAFEQGRLNADDEAACPGDWLPNRTDCVPGYVARADPDSPVWRCPVHGWDLQMDDMTLPWWNWQSLEKMHIEAP